ncbi:M10 family metallopeptidase C-terminal domain-containing protein [Aurantimonas coralicida]|uniref:M10 family metallopeptidase C-terminal domain-containing protein n=1 Tax=Aurantimonas coralicida TaxID=182270 RepID=UPI003517C631
MARNFLADGADLGDLTGGLSSGSAGASVPIAADLGTPERAHGIVVPDSVSAPSFGLSAIIQQLRTQWTPATPFEGYTYDWSQVGASGTVEYFIGGTPLANGSPEISGLQTMTALMQSRAALAFELWDELININLTRSFAAASTQIQFEYSNNTGGGTYASFDSVSYAGTNQYGNNDYNMNRVEIWADSTWNSHDTDADMYFGGYGFQTYLHEIGHALGLSHPGTYNAGSGGSITYAANAEYAEDQRKYTIMSYFGAYNPFTDAWTTGPAYSNYYYSSTPMIDDISAIQAIYGADLTTRTGNTTYGYNSNAGRDVFDFTTYGTGVPIFAIWDAGGNDTIDVSGYGGNQFINLSAGTYSNVLGYNENIAIARNVMIENATGGAGNDTLWGNLANNVLVGGAGADSMAGGGGDDTYSVDNAGDAVQEGFGLGSDVVYASINYTLTDNVESLVLTGGSNLFGTGNGLANYIFGNTGNNVINGAGGTDVMVGAAGDDTYGVDNGGDAIVENAGEGNDVVYITVSYDLPENVESLVMQGTGDLASNGNGLSNYMFGNVGNNYINGAGGNDVMVGGAGNDAYSVDTAGDAVSENGGEGFDTIYTSVSYDMPEYVESLIMTGTGDLATNGNGERNYIYGNPGNNYITGAGGDDVMVGGAGNDTYSVDSSSDGIIEQAGGGDDSVYASIDFYLPEEIETLLLTGSAVQGFGNSGNNQLFGNAGVNVLFGRGGSDYLVGGGGDDIFVVTAETGTVDIIGDFAGAGVAGGDRMSFGGFGAGATVTQVSQTSFQVASADGSVVQQFILQGHDGTALDSSDYYFA